MANWFWNRRPDASGPVPDLDEEIDFESVSYKPHRHNFDDDGTLNVRISVYDADSLSSAVMSIERSHTDYAFWCWIVNEPEYARSINEQELAEARSVYQSRQ